MTQNVKPDEDAMAGKTSVAAQDLVTDNKNNRRVDIIHTSWFSLLLQHRRTS